MTSTDLGNIHTTRNSYRGTISFNAMALKLPVFLPVDGEASWLLLLSLVSLLSRQHSATRKHIFIYPQGDRSGLRKLKKYKDQH